jgi:hypothetical protein
MSDGSQSHGGDASALRAVGVAAELAGGDFGAEIGGQGVCGSREDAVVGTAGRGEDLADEGLVHVEDGVQGTKPQEVLHDEGSLLGREDLRAGGSALWGEEAEPDLVDLGPGAPEAEELFEVAWSVCGKACDGGVNGDLGRGNILEDALVGGGLAPLVVLRLQAIDGHDYVESAEAAPFRGDDAEGAGDDLNVDVASVDLGEEHLQLAVTNEWVSSDEGDMQRLLSIDNGEDVPDEVVSLEIRELAKLGFAAEMSGIEGVAAGTTKWALFGDFDGE